MLGIRDSLVAQKVKNPLAMQETWVQSLGWEDPLEKGMGYPLQYFCLENSMDRGAWQAIVHGVAKSDMTAQLPFLLSHTLPNVRNVSDIWDTGLWKLD